MGKNKNSILRSIFAQREAFRSCKKLQEPIYEVPDSLQKSIPISRIHQNGVFELEAGKQEKTYDKLYIFSDMNYSDKDDREKEKIILDSCELLNMFQTGFQFKLCNFPQTESFKKNLYLELDGRTGYELELAKTYNEIFEKQIMEGSNGLSTVRMLIVTCQKESFDDAIAFFGSMEAELEEKFRQIESGIIPLSAEERLRYLYYMYNMEKIDEFQLNWSGLTVKSDWKNDICGDPFQVKKNYMDNGNQFISTLYIRTYPNGVKDYFIKRLLAVPCVSVITIDSEPVPKDIASMELRKIAMGIEESIQKQQRERNKIGAYTSEISYKKRSEKRDIEKYLSDMGDGDANVFFTQILITVFGSTKEELEKNVRSIESECKTNNFYTRRCIKRQLEAFQTALPTGGRYVEYMRPLFTQPLAGFVLFDAREVMQVGGKVYGYNRVSKKMIVANRKKLFNGNGMVMAAPGSGKSVMTKYEMGQVWLDGEDDMIVIDPQNEYFDIAEQWNGQVINLSCETETYFNPFELPEDRNVNYGQFVSRMAEFSMVLIETIMERDLTQYHKAVVERIVRLMYQEEQCRKDWISPTMFDFKRVLETQGGKYKSYCEDIALVIEPFIDGSLNIFAHETNVKIDSRFVVFGMKDLEKNLKRTAMLIMMNFIRNRVWANFKQKKATWIWCDEFHVLTGMPSLLGEVEQMFKTYRKFGGIVTGITQNISDMLCTKETRTMVANCEYLCLLKTEPIDQELLEDVLHLTKTQLKYITNNPKGTGILKFGKDIIGFNNKIEEKDNLIYQLFNTDMHEMAEKERRKDA